MSRGERKSGTATKHMILANCVLLPSKDRIEKPSLKVINYLQNVGIVSKETGTASVGN